jgi:chorismate mutase
VWNAGAQWCDLPLGQRPLSLGAIPSPSLRFAAGRRRRDRPSHRELISPQSASRLTRVSGASARTNHAVEQITRSAAETRIRRMKVLLETSSRSPEDIERLRAQLDALDHVLLDAVRDRVRCCVRIADFKRRHGVPMMQPHRIGIVQQRAAAYAAEHGIDATFLHRLYDLIIDETCRVEDLVIADADAAE